MASPDSSASSSSSSSSVTPTELIDEILLRKPDKLDFDLGQLRNPIDDLLALHQDKSPIGDKFAGLLSASHVSAVEDQWLTIVELIVNEIKELSEYKYEKSIRVLKAVQNVHWIAVGFLVLAATLKIANTTKNDECLLRLFQSMELLSRIMHVFRNLPEMKMELHSKLNESIHLIVKGAILCYSHSKIKRVSKNSTDGQELEEINGDIDDMCDMLYSQITSYLRTGQSSSTEPVPTANLDEVNEEIEEVTNLLNWRNNVASTPGVVKCIGESEIKRKLADSSTFSRLHRPKGCFATSSSSIISRVQDLRILQPKAYIPKRVGLGIYHHGMTPYSSVRGKEKIDALCSTVKRIKHMTVESLVEEIEKLNLEIRNWYVDSRGSLSEEILALNFTMDACFILEFFRLEFRFLNRDLEREIMVDIFKLENQIPLFLLRRILELEFKNAENAISQLAGMLCMRPQFAIIPFFLKPMKLKILRREIKAHIKENPRHLLHLLSKCIEDFLRPTNVHIADTSVDIAHDWVDFISTALDRGVDIEEKILIRFKRSKDGQVQLKKGWSGSGVLYLPRIYLCKETKPLFWNLIAFAVESENIIGHFICFMISIIQLRSKNVVLLKESKVIESDWSDKELHTIFNTLSNVICDNCGPFENVLSQVKKHYSSPLNRWLLRFTCLFIRSAVIGFILLILFVLF